VSDKEQQLSTRNGASHPETSGLVCVSRPATSISSSVKFSAEHQLYRPPMYLISSSGAVLMSARAPVVHSVHVYEEPKALISRLCGIVSSSLHVGDAVLIVATAEHREQLVKELLSAGLDLTAHARAGRYTMVDATEMLSTFMVNGSPDRHLFMASIGDMLTKARKAACSRTKNLTVFGEMVAVLWEQGKKHGALQLEGLWNDALHDRVFHLHCAYPRTCFLDHDDESAVLGTHSHVVQ
jgi:hypothetical protein